MHSFIKVVRSASEKNSFIRRQLMQDRQRWQNQMAASHVVLSVTEHLLIPFIPKKGYSGFKLHDATWNIHTGCWQQAV